MVAEKTSIEDIVRISRETLGLGEAVNPSVDDAFLAASLRRAAGILCPCSPSTLVQAVLESIQFLVANSGELADRLTSIVEGLVVIGDLLELSQVTVDDSIAKGTWVFAAPPSFVERPGGTIFIIGICSDEPTPLPSSLAARVNYEGFTRIISAQPPENLPSILRDLGLLELSKSSWLGSPKLESAKDLYDAMARKLSTQAPSGSIPDISILDSQRSVDYYSGRWIPPTRESGDYVARRPQAYGAPLWGFANLADGEVTKFLDFPLAGNRWRGCDTAWHLQMAIDSCRNTPQTYRRRPTSEGVCLDFFSPIPLWAHRRLTILGRQVTREKSLLSYLIPDRELAAEETFLTDRLWLKNREK